MGKEQGWGETRSTFIGLWENFPLMWLAFSNMKKELVALGRRRRLSWSRAFAAIVESWTLPIVESWTLPTTCTHAMHSLSSDATCVIIQQVNDSTVSLV